MISFILFSSVFYTELNNKTNSSTFLQDFSNPKGKIDSISNQSNRPLKYNNPDKVLLSTEGSLSEAIRYSIFSYTVFITGLGDMYNYSESSSPLYNYRNSIKIIHVSEGITTIGSHVFEHLNIQNIAIPQSVTKIFNYAFSCCQYLEDVYFLEKKYLQLANMRLITAKIYKKSKFLAILFQLVSTLFIPVQSYKI